MSWNTNINISVISAQEIPYHQDGIAPQFLIGLQFAREGFEFLLYVLIGRTGEEPNIRPNRGRYMLYEKCGGTININEETARKIEKLTKEYLEKSSCPST